MSFSTDMAKLVADQLSRFVTLNPHQLAGQVENLDFWLAEVRHALAVIDGYGVRFIRLHAAQERYVVSHNVTASVVDPAGVTDRPPPSVRRISDRELRQAQRVLVEATTRFLGRCRDEGLVADAVVAAALAEFA
jgi:dsDNA-binding SOS-regulon protein